MLGRIEEPASVQTLCLKRCGDEGMERGVKSRSRYVLIVERERDREIIT